MHRRITLISLNLALACTTVVLTSAARLSAGRSQVSFLATGPGGMRIEGKTSEFKVSEDAPSIVVTVVLGNLDTGIGLRDRHMRDRYLEVQKYPEATLSVSRSALRLPAAGATSTSDVEAQLSLHGRSKPIVVHYTAKQPSAGSYEIKGTFRMNMTDFGIEVPAYLGVTVKPDVDVAADFAVVDR